MKQTISNEFVTLQRLVDAYNKMVNPTGDENKRWLRCRYRESGSVTIWDKNNTAWDDVLCDRVLVSIAIALVARLMSHACNFPDHIYNM